MTTEHERRREMQAQEHARSCGCLIAFVLAGVFWAGIIAWGVWLFWD